MEEPFQGQEYCHLTSGSEYFVDFQVPIVGKIVDNIDESFLDASNLKSENEYFSKFTSQK